MKRRDTEPFTILGRAMRYVTDGGLETDLIFHHGVELPAFAAFPLVETDSGRELLREYYDGYAAIAAAASAGLMLEAPTWRANPDWAAQLGYSPGDLDRLNAASIEFLAELRAGYSLSSVVISGMVGPRGDGYVPGAGMTPDEAAAYHRPQLAAFASAGAERASALTLTDVGEAIGIVQAARAVGLPVAISFTVETDGRLASGASLRETIEAVDAVAPPDSFMVNCAHPLHVLAGLVPTGSWLSRIEGLRPNASQLSHAELDEAEVLDEGDPAALAADHSLVADVLPSLSVVGGCCGTDARHVAAMWGMPV